MESVLERLPRGARVVVIRLRSLGDCVLTTPALRILKSHRPDLDIDVVVEPRFAPIFESNPDVSRTLAPSLGVVRSRATWAVSELAWRLAQHRPDGRFGRPIPCGVCALPGAVCVQRSHPESSGNPEGGPQSPYGRTPRVGHVLSWERPNARSRERVCWPRSHRAGRPTPCSTRSRQRRRRAGLPIDS